MQRGRGLHHDQLNKASISLDPLEYFLVFLLRYPILSNQLFSEVSGTGGGFLSGNASRKISSLDLLNDARKGVQYWVNAIPYLFLLQTYLDEFFPLKHHHSHGNSSANLNQSSHQSQVEGHNLHQSSSTRSNSQALISMPSTRSFSTHDQEQYVNKYRQLFIQLIISFWVDQLVMIRQDHQILSYYRKLARANASNASSGISNDMAFQDFQDQQYQGNNANRPHPSPLELTVLDPVCKWTIPTCQVREHESVVLLGLTNLNIRI